MLSKETLNQLFTAIEQSITGATKENPKFDFKAKWYNLTDIYAINEFLKDTSSIANTVGPDGYIVIGFDEKNKQFADSVFSYSGLRDENELMGVITKRVVSAYTVNIYDEVYKGNKISILHIPPSFDKPHVIKEYKKFINGQEKTELNRIFFRQGANSVIAGKYEIDRMYYDRKNIIPEGFVA